MKFFAFERENQEHERAYRADRGASCVPCSAFVYERRLAFVRVENEQVHYLSEAMHRQICSNDELQFDTDDEEDGESGA